MKLDRRQNQMYLTRNTEYHVRNRECVGVRDRRTGQWLGHHPALRSYLLGAMDRKAKVFSLPLMGARLVFADRTRDILTSPLEEVARPDKPCVECYTWRTRVGIIEATG
jgi:hypothetical protein